ncbi:MAG: SemiSWEET transporter [Microscillaceae bacterium]|nr:SemiSWEET transporter [Microscillaceae bacterium]
MQYINWIGYGAAFLTTFAFLPQAFKTLQTRNTKGISLLSYSALVLGTIGWFVYGVLLGQWPIILANGVTFCFVFSIWLMKLRYG